MQVRSNRANALGINDRINIRNKAAENAKQLKNDALREIDGIIDSFSEDDLNKFKDLVKETQYVVCWGGGKVAIPPQFNDKKETIQKCLERICAHRNVYFGDKNTKTQLFGTTFTGTASALIRNIDQRLKLLRQPGSARLNSSTVGHNYGGTGIVDLEFQNFVINNGGTEKIAAAILKFLNTPDGRRMTLGERGDVVHGVVINNGGTAETAATILKFLNTPDGRSMTRGERPHVVQRVSLNNDGTAETAAAPAARIDDSEADITNRSATLELRDALGNPVHGKMVLTGGEHRIKILHGDKKGTTIPIRINQPFYFFENVQLPMGMKKPDHVVVMSKEDFRLLSSTIHHNAFGREFTDLKNGLVAVWKHPADLLMIEGYHPPQVEFPVGTYPLFDDLASSGENILMATKLRQDIVDEGKVVSLHRFVNTKPGAEFNFPGISTGNFFQDFNSPTQEELSRVTRMIDQLRSLGINASLCNRSQHAVFVSGMTPNMLAQRLRENPQIVEIISSAALPDQNMQQWAKIFIQVFGQ